MVWRSVRAGVALALLVGLFACSSTRGPGDPTREMSNVSVMGIEGLESPAQREGFALVQVTPDPIEGFNRGSLRFTQWVLDWGIIPLAKVWRFLLPEPVRRSVDNFAYNLSWPGRFVSLLLQGRLVDSGEETGHFLVNTTVGIAGLFDPATRMGIDTFRQDLGLAFASWGFQPGFYLVIPMLGPSSGRDGLGRIFDTALDPATYVTGAGMAFNLNALTFRIDGYESIRETQTNLYLPLRALWSIQRSIEVRDFRIAQEDFASADPEPSLGSLLLRPQEPDFARSGDRRHVRLLASGRDLPYSLWLQDEPAPLLYVIPGIGAHRASNAPVALAELGHAAGYSVAIVSSVFHREFLQAGLEVPYPGNTPRDAEAIHRALSAIHADIEGRRPGHVTSASVMGYSLGAIESLFLAATQDLRHADALRFERFVAINPPVDADARGGQPRCLLRCTAALARGGARRAGARGGHEVVSGGAAWHRGRAGAALRSHRVRVHGGPGLPQDHPRHAGGDRGEHGQLARVRPRGGSGSRCAGGGGQPELARGIRRAARASSLPRSRPGTRSPRGAVARRQPAPASRTPWPRTRASASCTIRTTSCCRRATSIGCGSSSGLASPCSSRAGIWATCTGPRSRQRSSTPWEARYAR